MAQKEGRLEKAACGLDKERWPGNPETPGGWGADVSGGNRMPGRRGNASYISRHWGRPTARLRQHCGFCDEGVGRFEVSLLHRPPGALIMTIR